MMPLLLQKTERESPRLCKREMKRRSLFGELIQQVLECL